MSVYIITLCDKNNIDKVNVLKNSIKDNYKLIILPTYDIQLGNLSKIHKTHDYLLNCDDIQNDDVVCIVDAFDVIYNTNTKIIDLYTTFVEQKRDIIFSSETKFSHHDETVKKYFDLLGQNYNNKYLNSGCIIAYKKTYISMFSDIIKCIENKSIDISHSKSDQRVLSLYIKNYMENDTIKDKQLNISLDYNNVFCTTVNTEYKNDPITIQSPFIHVTFLKNSGQNLKWNTLCKLLLI